MMKPVAVDPLIDTSFDKRKSTDNNNTYEHFIFNYLLHNSNPKKKPILL